MSIIQGKIFNDDRGSLRFVNDFDFSDVKRFYQVENLDTNIIRAFHGHLKESKYVYVPRGSVLVIVSELLLVDPCMENRQFVLSDTFNRYVLSANNPQILHIPAGYANGFRFLEQDSIIQFFSNKTLRESEGDDFRFEWDDLGIDIWETKNR